MGQIAAFKTKLDTSTAVTPSPAPSLFGTVVTFTATLSPGTATGTMTFKDGSTTICTSGVSGGMASCTTDTLATGNRSITAVYSGDDTYAPSTSPVLTYTIQADAAHCFRSVGSGNWNQTSSWQRGHDLRGRLQRGNIIAVEQRARHPDPQRPYHHGHRHVVGNFDDR